MRLFACNKKKIFFIEKKFNDIILRISCSTNSYVPDNVVFLFLYYLQNMVNIISPNLSFIITNLVYQYYS
ncbi:hypothetical protein RhiirC2_450073 [Rhizophagus irregularis]|uniref:Uncharacterized protein n=1 Tax=Rhizophagus irregularis TaxID=588596 RepID=A0A2N1NYW6_9GLOM|nr:hypothetical protein RhiirC2_450073 [Rhizophagus irregularis]